jgi:diamine N-acetyltransferase
LVVAEVGGEYAGFLYWHLGKNPFFDPKVAKFAHIREVQVLAKFQRRGIGRKLMTYALDRLGGLGVSDVFLSTAETNDIAKHLYEAIGFEEFRKQIHYRLRMKPGV